MPRSERLRRTRVALVAGSLLLIGFAAGGSIWFAARTIDWDRLSNVGQAFGTISAALSAVALVGVAVAIYIQVQQTTISREYAVRSMRVDEPSLCSSTRSTRPRPTFPATPDH